MSKKAQSHELTYEHYFQQLYTISDVVEFSDEMASRYFYVEPKGFAEIVFKLK